MKRLIWALIVILLTLAGLALLYQFREAIVMFLASLAIAAVFRPVIDWLKNHRVPKTIAILLPYLFGFGLLGVLVYFGTAAILVDLRQAADQFAVGYTRFLDNASNGTELQKSIAEQLPPIEAIYESITGDQGQAFASNILGIASGLAGFLSQTVIVIVLSVYWSIDENRFERLWLTVLPAAQRVRARDIWRGIEKGVGSYIRSEIVQLILVGLLLSLLYSLMHLPYPALLGLLGALFWLIPWLGAVLAVIPPLIGGVSMDPATAAAAAIVTLLVLLFMELIVEPRFFTRQRYSSILIVLFMIALADAFGLIGVLIAPPLAAAVQIFFGNLLSQPLAVTPADPLVQLTQLRSNLLRLREEREDLDQDTPHVDSWIDRLDSLIKKAEETINREDRPSVRPAGTQGQAIR